VTTVEYYAKTIDVASSTKFNCSYIIGPPFVKQFALCYRTMVCPVCLSVCNIGVLWPNGWMDQHETCRAGRPRPRPHCVRWGPSSPQNRGTAPNFRPMSVVAKWLDRIKMPLGTKVVLGPGNVLDADPAPPLQRAQPHPQFLAHVCCGQTAGWTKMPLGTKVGLGPGHTVTWESSSPQKGGTHQFSAHVYCGHTVIHLSYC